MYVKGVECVNTMNKQRIKGYVKDVKSGVCGFYTTIYIEQ